MYDAHSLADEDAGRHCTWALINCFTMEAIIYHRVDWDGYTSAAVAKMAFPDAELIGWSYGDNEPEVSKFDRVIVVDLSLSESWMLSNTSKLIWIDHHKNVIETLQNNPVLAAIPGIRKDGIGACALTWEYFFNDEKKPIHVKFVATADVMDTSQKLAPLWHALAYGLYLDTFGPGWSKETGDISKNLVKLAMKLFDDNMSWQGFLAGQDLEMDRAAHERHLFESAKSVINGGFRLCIVHIDSRPNACILSHLLKNTHDAFICIGDFLEDKGKYKISIRVPSESSFDASAFCRQYGGNGHIKAAGCMMSEEEIQSLL